MHSIETLTDYQRKYPKHCSFLYDWWFAFVTCRLISALHKTGVKSLFPVQVAVWKQIIGPGGGERDLCICSPTGSGKTLAYCLPVVQMLASRVVRRLRALIVLPTRDLAIQVYISITYKQIGCYILTFIALSLYERLQYIICSFISWNIIASTIMRKFMQICIAWVCMCAWMWTWFSFLSKFNYSIIMFWLVLSILALALSPRAL